VPLQTDLVPTLRELGIGILAYSPMGRGLLTGTVTLDSMGPNDFRRLSAPHFSEENIHKASLLISVQHGPVSTHCVCIDQLIWN